MKNKITVTIVVAILFIAQVASATVWRVNNRVNSAANFTTIQDAHDGAASGDTLYIEGSPTSYGNLNCTKQLTIIGAGGFLNENDSTQAYKEMSQVGTINFQAGSENSIMEGLYVYNSAVNIYTSNITIRRNQIINNMANYNQYGIAIAGDCENVLIENNWIKVQGEFIYAHNNAIYSTGANLTNLTIRNNYLYSKILNVSCFSLYLSATVLADNVTVYQNVFDCNTNGATILANETQFYNNIVIKGSFTPAGSYYNNNIGSGTQFGTANGNMENVAAATIFVDPTSGVDSDLQLKAGSPALGAGLFGEDCGMYGADHPYIISLFPAIPAIWDVSLNNYGNDNVTIDVNIKAKSHN